MSVDMRKQIEELLNFLDGKPFLIYGQPYAGKSWLLAFLCRYYTWKKGKKGVIFMLDKNILLDEELYENYKRVALDPIIIDVPIQKDLGMKQTSIITMIEQNASLIMKSSFVAVDSITGIAEAFNLENPISPSITRATSGFASAIMLLLMDYARKYKIPAVLVAHAGQQFTGKFFGEDDRPTHVSKSTKNTFAILKIVVPDKNPERRFLKIIVQRSIFDIAQRKFVPIISRKIFPLDEVINYIMDKTAEKKE